MASLFCAILHVFFFFSSGLCSESSKDKSEKWENVNAYLRNGYKVSSEGFYSPKTSILIVKSIADYSPFAGYF